MQLQTKENKPHIPLCKTCPDAKKVGYPNGICIGYLHQFGLGDISLEKSPDVNCDNAGLKSFGNLIRNGELKCWEDSPFGELVNSVEY
jgi:hypothetical protein